MRLRQRPAGVRYLAAAVGLLMVLISFGALAMVNALQLRLAKVGRA